MPVGSNPGGLAARSAFSASAVATTSSGTSITASSSAPAAPTGSGSGSERRGLGRMPCESAIGTPARANVRCTTRGVSRCER